MCRKPPRAILNALRSNAANVFKINWRHMQRQRFRIELVSEGELVSQPIPISIGLTDRKPSVRLRYTGVGQRITPNAMIPLTVESRDDYGLHQDRCAAASHRR